MTFNFNIKQKRYAYTNLQIVLNNVELVSIGKIKSRIFDFWPHDFDFAPLCGVKKSFNRQKFLLIDKIRAFSGSSIKSDEKWITYNTMIHKKTTA